MIWTAVRVLLIIAALGVLFLTPLYTQSSDGTTQLLTDGVIIDTVALLVIAGSAWSLWRDRREREQAVRRSLDERLRPARPNATREMIGGRALPAARRGSAVPLALAAERGDGARALVNAAGQRDSSRSTS